jgi:hypothetical protein
MSQPDPVALDGLGEALWWLGQPRRSNESAPAGVRPLPPGRDAARAVPAAPASGIAVTYESNFG